jgi:DNA modification methylase
VIPLYTSRRTSAYFGDCRDVLAHLIAKRGAFASMAWIDGPYGMGKGEWDRLTGARHNRSAVPDEAVEARVSRYVDLLSDLDPDGADLAAWYAPVLYRISAACLQSASAYVWNTDAGEAVLRPIMQALGWTFRGRVTWDKMTTKALIGANDMRTWLDVTEVCGFYQREPADLFEALASRMCSERDRVGVSRAAIDAAAGTSNVSQYWWQSRGWRLPTRPMWDILQRVSGGFRWDWEDLRREEEGVRAACPAFSAPIGVSNVWRHNAVSGSERLRINGEAHPCQKPLAFAERAILASTRPGEVVLDPFAGTCRCAVAVERLPASEAREVVSIDTDRCWLEAVRPSLLSDPMATATAAQPSLFGGSRE